MMDELSEEIYDGIDGNDGVAGSLYIQDETRTAIEDLQELLNTVSPLPYEGLDWTTDAVIMLSVMEMYRQVEERSAEKSMTN